MLLAALVDPAKVVVGSVLALGGLVALIVYLPAAVVREATWPEDEPLPPWMGTVRARRTRLRVAMAVLGVLAAAATAAFVLGG